MRLCPPPASCVWCRCPGGRARTAAVNALLLYRGALWFSQSAAYVAGCSGCRCGGPGSPRSWCGRASTARWWAIEPDSAGQLLFFSYRTQLAAGGPTGGCESRGRPQPPLPVAAGRRLAPGRRWPTIRYACPAAPTPSVGRRAAGTPGRAAPAGAGALVARPVFHLAARPVLHSACRTLERAGAGQHLVLAGAGRAAVVVYSTAAAAAPVAAHAAQPGPRSGTGGCALTATGPGFWAFAEGMPGVPSSYGPGGPPCRRCPWPAGSTSAPGPSAGCADGRLVSGQLRGHVYPSRRQPAGPPAPLAGAS